MINNKIKLAISSAGLLLCVTASLATSDSLPAIHPVSVRVYIADDSSDKSMTVEFTDITPTSTSPNIKNIDWSTLTKGAVLPITVESPSTIPSAFVVNGNMYTAPTGMFAVTYVVKMFDSTGKMTETTRNGGADPSISITNGTFFPIGYGTAQYEYSDDRKLICELSPYQAVGEQPLVVLSCWDSL